MKKIIRNSRIVILLLTIFSSLTYNASAMERKIDTLAVTFRYLGDVDNQPVFQLQLSSATEELVLISIKDQYGVTLYFESVKAKNLTRQFNFSNDVLWDSPLFVQIRTRKNKPKTFVVSSSMKISQEFKVSKM